MHDYWHRQTAEHPLFPYLLWSRPENKNHAGKLLIVGGDAHGFAAAAEAYGEAVKAGIGTARVILPDSLRKTFGKVFEAGEFAPTTPTGSFSQKALTELLTMSQWSDAVLLAGDFGRNSETAIMLERFIEKYTGPLTLTQDAADYFTKSPHHILVRKDTLLVISFAQLQKIATSVRFNIAFTFDMDFLHIIDTLHAFTAQHQVAIIVKHLQTVYVAINGKVSTTKLDPDQDIWRVKTAAQATTWWLQNPSKVFEAFSTSILQIKSLP